MTKVAAQAERPKRAVIIRGNHDRPVPGGIRIYRPLERALQRRGWDVVYDEGRPYTSPPKEADAWIGYSRGADRLRFAPKGVKTVAIGAPTPSAINHKKDASVSVDPEEFDRLPKYVRRAHGTANREMVRRVLKQLGEET